MSEVNFTSKAQGNLNTVLGAIGTAGGVPEILGGLFGGGMRGWGNPGYGYGSSPHEHFINRYEAGMQEQLAHKDMEIAYLRGREESKKDDLEAFKYYDARIGKIEEQLCAQAVVNQKTADAFDLVRGDLLCCKNELYTAIGRERDERMCADNAIVNYVNATFYPKMVADVTTGTTTTAQLLYNPIPNCGQKCC